MDRAIVLRLSSTLLTLIKVYLVEWLSLNNELAELQYVSVSMKKKFKWSSDLIACNISAHHLPQGSCKEDGKIQAKN